MATVSGGTTRRKYAFIAKYRALGVRYLCRWFSVSPSGFYDWLTRGESKRVQRDRELTLKITSIHKKSGGVYGSPRIHEALKRQGETVGKNRVASLMKANQLKGRAVLVTRRQPGLKRFKYEGKNLRREQGPPTGIDQQWVSDVTYLKLQGAWLYLAVVIDVYSRRVLGWSLSKTRTPDVTLSALRYALKKRIPKKGLIFHTDRGAEYVNHRFRAMLKQHGMLVSVNRPGQCTDNAHVESFFHSLKAELIRERHFNSVKQLRYALSRYLGHFYNRQRLHSGIGYCSPVEYEYIQG